MTEHPYARTKKELKVMQGALQSRMESWKLSYFPDGDYRRD